MATLPPMAIPIAPAMPIPSSTSSGLFEPMLPTAKVDNKDEEQKDVPKDE